ncbi:MAG: type II toxin-antitoxin system HicB family antitoxin [Bacteroidales bacterium]|nr:type II toxin-antitoxin system HicB family antitoxin [Bacteroidales bacterium]
MEKIVILIDWVPSNFAATPLNQDIPCVATGKTLEEVKKNAVDALEFHLAGLKADGETVPASLADQWYPEFRLTTRAQLKYTDNYITRKALSRETGIAEQQLSHYANGQRHPRPAMQQRITAGILAISRRLAVIL